MREKSKQTPIGFTEKHREMIEAIRDHIGAATMSAAVQHAVAFTYRKDVMHHTNLKSQAMSKAALSPEEKARNRAQAGIDEKAAKAQIIEDQKIEIMKKLGGKLVKGIGSKMVHYYMYDGRNRYLQQVPLLALSDDLLPAQYSPTREKVRDRQINKETNYTLTDEEMAVIVAEEEEAKKAKKKK